MEQSVKGNKLLKLKIYFQEIILKKQSDQMNICNVVETQPGGM